MHTCLAIRNSDVQNEEANCLRRPGRMSHYLNSVDTCFVPSSSGQDTKKVLLRGQQQAILKKVSTPVLDGTCCLLAKPPSALS